MHRSPTNIDKVSILKYWSQVEFFSPYLLDRFLTTEQNYQHIFASEPCACPWQEKAPLEKEDPTHLFSVGYHLYLGIFNTEETADRARHVFCQIPNQWTSIDWRQCSTSRATSCFARLSITPFGTPLLGSLTLSTLPWAHGHLLNEKAAFLSMETFWKHVKRLLTDLEKEFLSSLPKQLVRKPKEYASTLDHSSLVELNQMLFNWAGYTPKEYPIAIIVPLENQDTTANPLPKNDLEKNIPILNSFYIQDLERAIISLPSEKNCALNLYLNKKNSQQISIDEKEGKALIFETLRPSHLPKGRWPAHPSHQLSLMQQFAVNQANLKKSPLFSVNGPPGTGKSTLLREMIAENLVARAQALAHFNEAKDVFIAKRAIGFGDTDPIYVNDLHPSVFGQEMLVVSSNNAAVQNLSHELPLRAELDPSYQEASYLEPVAQRLLDLPETKAWGLISAALGNKENCSRLVERVFIDRDDNMPGKRIWDWIKEYQGISFKEAKKRFLALHKQHEKLIEKLDTLFTLHDQITGKKLQKTFEEDLLALEKSEQALAKIQEEKIQLQKQKEKAQEQLSLLEYREKLWNKERPALFNRFTKGKKWEKWSEKASAYTQQKVEAITALHRHQQLIDDVETRLQEKKKEIEAQEFELFSLSFFIDACQTDYEQLKNLYPDVHLIAVSTQFDERTTQMRGHFQNEKLKALRSEIFIAAMTLQQAWLAETAQSMGGFRGNLMAIGHLLQGKTPSTTDDTTFLWKCVFLLIPVISSTFASIERLFRYVSPQSIAWLFIDEAGQAIPQAAVGAIWRAQHVLSIGDPFQIEPISSVSAEIVDGMAKYHLNDHSLEWAPSQISVQNRMDAVSCYGSKRQVRSFDYWLSSPLRVHRRCEEPMFSIANAIAYEGNMILATPIKKDKKLEKLPQSCWYDVPGYVLSQHYVSEQGIKLIEKLAEVLSILSEPDIFIISPFREVVQQIQSLTLREGTLQGIFKVRFQQLSFSAWAKKSIGTVHTFQGKQAAIVFLVLGADKTMLGSVDWASRKPNLLNVAVTRACHRFYIVGDHALWGRFPYFDVAAEKLHLS